MANITLTPEQLAYEKRIQDAVAAAQAKQTQQAAMPSSGSNSMIGGMYDNALRARIAALEDAYKASLADATAAKDKIPGIYQAQANTVAANAGREKRNFNEYAAASGLNSGAGGQAALALSGQLQSGLAQVRTNEANALSDADLQIAKLKAQYQQQMQQAVADNLSQRAAALLDQYNREQSNAIQQQQWNANFGLQQQQMAANLYDAEYQRQLNNAKLLASVGDYSGFKALGWTDAQIAQAQAAAATPTYSGSGGGGGGYAPQGYESVYQTMQSLGITDAAGAYAYLLSNGYTDTEATNLASYYQQILAGQKTPTANNSNFGDGYNSLYTSVNYAIKNGATEANISAMIMKALSDGRITEQGAYAILANMGLI